MKNQLKFAIAMGCAAMLYPAAAIAEHHGDKKMAASKDNAALHAALKSDARKKDMARDKYRNPAETLAFFQVKPNHTLVEYGPGGGWYTRLLAPYISENGKYIALNSDSGARSYSDRTREGRAKSWVERFPGIVNGWTGVDADKITAIEIDEVSDEMKGTADRVVIFRSLHGLMNGNASDATLRAVRSLLKDDGMVGVVQHRAPADESYARSKGTRGYLREQDVINLFALHGFELVARSDINANAKDKADYPNGVWTLPPVRRFDKENDAKYQAIGETDRMTLLFKKRP